MKYIQSLFFFIYKLYLLLIFAITALLFAPFLYFLTKYERFHHSAYHLFSVWSYVYRIFALWPLIVENKNKQKVPRPMIIVANHASFADIFVAPSLLKDVPHIFLGKSEILNYPIIKHYFKEFNIPVYRDSKIKAAKSLVKAQQKLKKGWSVLIFPEGGIPDGNRPEMIPFKDGAFQLAKQTNTPILPITFKTNYKLFSDPTNFFGTCMPGFSRVTFHELISREQVKDSSIEELKQVCYGVINSELTKN